MNYCPSCGNKIESDESKFCGNCGGRLNTTAEISSPSTFNNSSISSKPSNDVSDQITYMQMKKSIGIAILLNILWAGWGIYYCRAQNGRWIAGINIIAFVLSFVTFAMPCLVLCIWASIICNKHIEIYNLELQQAIEHDTMREFRNKYL